MLNMLIDMLGRVNTKTNNTIKADFLFITIRYKNKKIGLPYYGNPATSLIMRPVAFRPCFTTGLALLHFFSLLLSVK